MIRYISRVEILTKNVDLLINQNRSQQMRKEERSILQNIGAIEKNQGPLLQKPKTIQQQFLHLFAHRILVNKKMIHKNVEEALTYLPGSFSNFTLRNNYMALCLQNRIELPPEEYPILKMLIDWTEYYPTLKGKRNLQLISIVFQEKDTLTFNSPEQLVSYLNFIGADILKLLRINDEGSKSRRESSERYNIENFNAEDLIQFLNLSFPKILINILLPAEVLPGQLKKTHQSFECLYKNHSMEYYMRSKQNYSVLIRNLIKILLEMNLKVKNQKQIMEIVFRYFYAYHHDKKYLATQFVIRCFNKLEEQTRFALADQFILFFRIAKKIGKGQFVEFLIQKSPWLKSITSKITDKNLIGYPKDGVNPHNLSGISDKFVVQSRTVAIKTFQILEDFSLFYFRIGIESLDITIRLYYLGEIDAPKAVKTLLVQQEKKSGEMKNNVMAARRGIYQFQFDNSYSWINSKTISFDNVILTPMQIKIPEINPWANAYFQGVPRNQAIKDIVVNIIRSINQKKAYQSQDQDEEENTKHKDANYTGNITKNGPFFNMKVIENKQVYEFQTQNQDRFVKKFNQLMSANDKLKWTINGQPLLENEDLGKIFGGKQSNQLKKKIKPPPKKEVIDINYEQYVEEEENVSKDDKQK